MIYQAEKIIEYLKVGDFTQAQNEAQAIFNTFKNSGTAAAIGLGKAISRSDLSLEQILPLVQFFWDENSEAGKTFAVSILSKRAKLGDRLMPVIYRMILSCESDEAAERMALTFLTRFFKENPDYAGVLADWEQDPAPYMKKIVEIIKQRA